MLIVVDTILYSYILLIDYSFLSYSSFCLSCNLSYVIATTRRNGTCSLLTSAKLSIGYLVVGITRELDKEPSLSKSLTMDLTFMFIFHFIFCFVFLLFLEQLRLGFISHAVTLVTNWWRSHKTDHGAWENEVEGSKTKWHHIAWTTHVGLMLYSWSFRVGCTVASTDHG